MAINNISTLPTKAARQIAKLDLSAEKRVEQSNPRAYYNLDLLPTRYATGDNTVIVDNPNSGGLVSGRPWTTTP